MASVRLRRFSFRRTCARADFLARTSYVPISTDFSDLWSTMAFFRGDLEGRGAHDDLAKEIAAAGKKWTAEHWRWQDMQVCE